MEALSETEIKNNKKRNRRIGIGFFAVGVACLVCIIVAFSQRSQIGSLKNDLTKLSDSLGKTSILANNTYVLAQKTATLVKDTMYPVMASQQEYLAKFDKSLLDQKKEIYSTVNLRLNKTEKTLEAIKSNQVSFAHTFNSDLEKIKGRIDSTKIKATLPSTTNDQNCLTLPNDTSKTKLLVLDGDKKTGQSNGDKGGQKKRLGLKRLFSGQK